MKIMLWTALETNKETDAVIATFLGWELNISGRKFKYSLPPFGFVKAHPDYLKFHRSWDWLVLAINKIYDLYNASDHDREWHDRTFGVRHAVASIDIQRTYNEVIDFIKWYNAYTA